MLPSYPRLFPGPLPQRSLRPPEASSNAFQLCLVLLGYANLNVFMTVNNIMFIERWDGVGEMGIKNLSFLCIVLNSDNDDNVNDEIHSLFLLSCSVLDESERSSERNGGS